MNIYRFSFFIRFWLGWFEPNHLVRAATGFFSSLPSHHTKSNWRWKSEEAGKQKGTAAQSVRVRVRLQGESTHQESCVQPRCTFSIVPLVRESDGMQRVLQGNTFFVEVVSTCRTWAMPLSKAFLDPRGPSDEWVHITGKICYDEESNNGRRCQLTKAGYIRFPPTSSGTILNLEPCYLNI